MSDSLTTDSPESDELLARIEATVADVAACAHSESDVDCFYNRLLDSILDCLDATSATVWITDNPPLPSAAGAGDTSAVLQRIVERGRSTGRTDPDEAVLNVLADGQGLVHSPDNSADRPASPPDADGLRLVSPVFVEGRVVTAIDVHLPPDASTDAVDGFQRFIDLLAESATVFHLRRIVAELKADQDVRSDRSDLPAVSAGGRTVRETAYNLVNDGHTATGCDRASLIVHSAGRWKVAAVSGVDVVDERSDVARGLAAVAHDVAMHGDEIWIDDNNSAATPPVVESAIEFLQRSGARAAGLVPLLINDGSGEQTASAVLVVEWFRVPDDADASRRSVAKLARACVTALAPRLEIERLPFIAVNRVLASVLRLFGVQYVTRTVATIVALLAAAAALVFIPADMKIAATGTLQPEAYQDLFAPANAVVETIHVHHLQEVQQHDPLVRLRSSELDMEYTRLSGERDTVARNLATVRAERRSQGRPTSNSTTPSRPLGAREEELRVRLQGLDAQLAALQKETDRLTLVSPMDGTVLTWNLRDRLKSRPIHRGDRLLSVAATGGNWIVELDVADEDIGHVFRAASEQDSSELPVSFRLKSRPGDVYEGRIARTGDATEYDEIAGSIVKVSVAFEHSEDDRFRPGATVIASIGCGRRAVGYVWFHEIIDALRTRVWP